LGKRASVRIAVGDRATTILEAASEGEETRSLIAGRSRGLGSVDPWGSEPSRRGSWEWQRTWSLSTQAKRYDRYSSSARWCTD